MYARWTRFFGMVGFVIAQNALAQIDTWSFRGVITTGLPGSPYQAGLPYSANFAVDASRLTPNSMGLYFPTLGYSWGVTCCGFGASSVGSGVLIANDQPTSGGGSFDGIIFSMFGEQSTGFPTGSSFDGSAFGVTLVSSSAGPTATPLIGTSFPSTLDLNQFSQRDMAVYFQGSPPVRGTVDSLYLNGVLVSQVPEPSFFSLSAIGTLVLLRRSIRRIRSWRPLEQPENQNMQLQRFTKTQFLESLLPAKRGWFVNHQIGCNP